MQVLVLAQYYAPEPVPKPSEIAEELTKRGHSVTVLTGFPNYPSGALAAGYRLAPFLREVIRGVPVLANEVTPDAGGWMMHFRDDSANGHDKAAAVRAAAADEKTVAYVGDGSIRSSRAVARCVRVAGAEIWAVAPWAVQ